MSLLQDILHWSQTLPGWQSDAVHRLFVKGQLSPPRKIPNTSLRFSKRSMEYLMPRTVRPPGSVKITSRHRPSLTVTSA